MVAGKPIIGLAGGIGSGKSTVAAILEELGSAVIASDRLNHEELDEPEVLSCLREWWGDTVVGPDGRANRAILRQIVAGDAAARQRLERLVHPRIARRREALTRRYADDPAIRAIVWDSPLLFEAGLDRQCDWIVFVDAPRDTRLGRVLQKRGWTPEDLDRLEKSQKPLDIKRDRAHYRVTNNSDFESLHRQVQEVFSRILASSHNPT
ncbi:MAG: dephospho-CoA kinase [Phycisphaerae bacterium]